MDSWAKWATNPPVWKNGQICLEVPFLRRQVERRGFPCPAAGGEDVCWDQMYD
jgi:hypothetical protein